MEDVDGEAEGREGAEDLSSPFDVGGASACDSEDCEASTSDCVSSCGEVIREGSISSPGGGRLLRSSSGSAIIAIRVPTLTPLDPSGCCMLQVSFQSPVVVVRGPLGPLTVILAICPSS